MKKLQLIIYYIFFSKLPNSWWPGGKLYNRMRVAILKGVLNIGGGTRVQRLVYIGNGKNIVIGKNCQLNEKVRLSNVHIGNNVMIGRESIVLGKTHESGDLDEPMAYQGVKLVQQSQIEDDVWIGLRVVIMPGVRVRKGCIIGAGAVVTKDTEAYGVYGGVPAKLIKSRK